MAFMKKYKHQPKVTRMLLNSYQKGRLAHAYLFEGELGTPKKELAIDFAKLLYCEGEEKPCDACMNCIRIEHLNHPNILYLEPDGNTLKKEQILYLQQEYVKTALEEGPKIYIIDQIDRMSINAANSILKFIEEPEDNVYTILITDHIHQILPTIKSRCQVINFQPIDTLEIAKELIALGIDDTIALVCSHLENNLEAAKRLIEDEMIEELISLTHQVAMAVSVKKHDPIVLCHQATVDVYGDKRYAKYLFDMLLIYMRDMQKVKVGNDQVRFKAYLEDMKFMESKMSEEKLMDNIKALLGAKVKLDANAHTMLLMDDLLININKVV